MSENDRYKQALEDNFGQNSGANARFGNPNVQKLLQQLDSDREIHTHSWSENSLASSSRKNSSSNKAAADTLASLSGKDRFIPSQQDLIKSISSSHSKRSSSSSFSDSRSSRNSSSSSSEQTKKYYPDSDNSTLTKETKRFVIGLGLLCFIIGALLITFLYSPLNERGASRVLDGTAIGQSPNTEASSAEDPNITEKGAETNLDNGNNNDASIIMEVDSKVLSEGGLQTDKKTLPVVGKIKLDGIKVYVVGAVKRPGIVTLPFDSRVDDAIKAAGGMTNDAEPLSVNLAKRIKDEDKIYVAVKGENNTLSGTGVVEQKSDTSGIVAEKTKNDTSRTSAPEAENSEKNNKANENKKEKSAEFKINLNSATEEELQKIPGIGPSISKSIIDKRNSMPEGKFTNKAQLKDVIGVGDSNYSKFESYLDL
ncbi:MAG: helix-hairpin-helix domain-containing protein [Candidatus Bruticola sp.]